MTVMPATSSLQRPERPPRAAASVQVRALAVLVITLLSLVVSLGSAPHASAHAFLKSSKPAMNDVLQTNPGTVTMEFSEPLEPSGSSAKLYDRTGAEIPGASSAVTADYQMTLTLPESIPNGTYTVVWQSLSAADGHSASGYISFTIGTTNDIWSVVLPPIENPNAPPDWVVTGARGLTYLGLAGSLAAWPIWLFVLRPSVSPVWQLGPVVTRRARMITAISIGLALAGSVLMLLVQAMTADDSLVQGLVTTLTETRFGQLWFLRVTLLLAYALVLTVAAWWFPRHRKWLALAGLVLAAALPLPLSLISHANAQLDGRETAVVNDLLHVLGASLWAGGVIFLVFALVPLLHRLTPSGKKVVLTRAIPRFSFLALIAWGIIALSGFYNAWLQVGNWTALTETGYGQTLAIKLLLIVPLLALAAFNLLVVTRRIRAAASAESADKWSRRFQYAVGAELVLGILVLGITGRLTNESPARDELAQQSGQIVTQVEVGDRSATFGLAPGATGDNHFRIEVSGSDLPLQTRAMLRISLPAQGIEQQELSLYRVFGNAFEWHGTELSLPGTWSFQLVIRQPGQPDLTGSGTVTIGTDPPKVDVPAPPPLFDTAGIAGLLLIVAGIVGLVVALQSGQTSLRGETIGLAAVGLVIGSIIVLQARVDPELTQIASANPIPADEASITRGQEVFRANCMACHGSVGRGDGPAASDLSPRPADLTTGHALIHSDRDLFFLIENGIQGSAMPGFGGSLSDADIWNTINFVQDLQAQAANTRNAPIPSMCDITPRTVAELQALGSQYPLGGGLGTPTSALATAVPVTSPSPVTSAPAGQPGADSPLAATPGSDSLPVWAIQPSPTLPAGEPAPPEVSDAAYQIVEEMVACSNARDTLRRLATFSDEYVAALYPGGPSDSFASLVATPAAPVALELRMAVVGIDEVRIMPDGRAAAIVTLDNPVSERPLPPGMVPPGEETYQVMLVYFRQDPDHPERWLIDEMIP